jgi:long-chain fatty acid transport protein
MNQTVFRVTLALCLVVGAASCHTASAQAFRNPPESAAALSLLGGHYALLDDPSALSFNPANLGWQEDVEALASVTMVLPDVKFRSPLGFSESADDDSVYLPNVHAVVPLQGNLVAGLGVTTPFGQSTKWSKTGPVSMLAPYHAELLTMKVNPTLIARVSDTFAVSASADLFYSELELRQTLPFGRVKLEGDDTAVGGTFGATWKPMKKHTLGVAYHLGADMKYDGDTHITGFQKSDFDSEIKLPAILGLGYALDVTDTLRVGVDVEWMEWSRNDTLPLDLGANNMLGLIPGGEIPQDWDDTWNVGAAAEWQMNPAWVARCGWIYMETPIPDSTMAPTLPDGDRHVISVGLGYENENHAVDLAYAYNIIDDNSIDSNQNPLYNGKYEIDSQLLNLSYAYTF